MIARMKMSATMRKLFKDFGVLLGMIGAIFVVFLGQVLFGPFWYQPLMAVPGEVVGSIQAIRSGDALTGDWLELGTLLSYAFLHGGFDHIALNMVFMWAFGALLIELIGWRWMVGIWVMTVLAGSATHVAMNHEDFIPMLGASGGVLGLEGAYFGLAVRWRLPDPHVWPLARPIPPSQLALFAVLGVALDYFAIFGGSLEMTAYGAHVGGFTMGLLITALVVPKPKVAGG